MSETQPGDNMGKAEDIFVKDELPGYPEGLKKYPKNYTIYLSPEDWHPLENYNPNAKKEK